MTVGQLVGRLVREALDRHDPSRRRPRTGSRPADAHAHAAPTPAAEPAADRRTASAPKQPARPAVSVTSTAQTRPGCDGHAAAAPKSRDSGRAIPAAVKREVWQRDGGRCRYVDPHTGRRCTSRHLLQIDHVLPYALGGGSDPGNLRLLCHAHHRHRHRHRSASVVSPTRNPEDPRDLTAGFRDELIDATQTPMRVPAPWHSMRLRPCWPRNTIVAPARPAGLPQSTMNKIRSDLRVILIGGSSHSRRKVDAIEIAG